ncbi:copper-binding protein [Caulobacter endophyticus]|uniref:copper-binding protein n=1 Tax=Caulobacter endophyticus TaxID=2172652 RepID=UPI00240F060B|nr:copper-binding protein [Caulobacter endophyticus]MDG2529666.1 copper-binding protein [Caulobacter endophyticus]
MKFKAVFAFLAVFALAGCGPGDKGEGSKSPAVQPPPPISTAPQHETQGVISIVDGQVLTLDHDGASAAPLPAGRTVFQAYGDVLAEAPLEPGARVTFKFRKVAVGEGWELTEMRAR